MPSTIHQALVGAFADDPSLAFDLAREVFGLEVPALGAVSDRRAELDAFSPCFGDTKELRPDLALAGELATPDLKTARKYRGGVGMILEVQRDVERAKRWRTWVYWALFAERLQCTTMVMLVTLEDHVARWGRRLGSLELPSREGLLVLDRQNMPRVSESVDARRRPAKALISALLHARNDDITVMSAGLRAALELRDDRRWRYASAIMGAAPENRQPELLQEHLTMEQRYELTQLERNSIAFHDGRREGILEGKREGILEGLVQLVLTILELRQVSLDPRSEDHIRACKDPERLERWVDRARQVASADELFR